MILEARRASRPSAQYGSIPAPFGVNLVDNAGSLPPGDCLHMVNYVRSDYGARTRAGYREWVTGLGDDVRSVFGFQGSLADGSEDRLFATIASGIYDVTASTGTPGAAQLTFASSTATSGYGIACAFTTIAGGHFLLYCDEENGYHVYDEATNTWAAVAAGIGAGQINGVDPALFAFVSVWKRRLWFVEADSASAWYLPVNQYTGTVTEFDFGPQFKHGGHLVGLWSWTIDGGSGIDDLLVAISSSGDVVVYQGSDPADSNTFSLRGVWYAGAVPKGRKIATEQGGDLLILSALGLFPLSKLVGGASLQDLDLYATRKIAPVITRIMTERSGSLGWFTQIHPEDATLLIGTPAVVGEDREQWAMSLSARAWAQHIGLPMTCSEAWDGKLYFGTDDGRICINDGDVDNNQLTGSTNAIAIDSQLLLGFQNLGTARVKRLQMVKPQFITDGTLPQYDVAGRTDFDRTEVGSVTFVPSTSGGVWDAGAWDVAVWGTGEGTAGEWRGVSGMGSQVSLAMRMSTQARTTLLGFDVMFDLGGAL